MQISIQHKHQQRLSQFMHLAMVILLAYVIAYWVMVFAKPKTESSPLRTESSEEAIAPRIIAAQWFGEPGTDNLAPTVSSNYRLLGVFSRKKQKGFAILAGPDGKQFSALLHESFAPQVSLEVVRANEVVIKDHGVERTIRLEGLDIAKSVTQSFQARGSINTTPKGSGLPSHADNTTLSLTSPSSSSSTSANEANKALLERLQKRDEEIKNGH